MSATKHLISLGRKIEQKLTIKAQMSSAQAADVEDTLKAAGLWDLSNTVSPMLNSAGVPEDVKVHINIVVDKGLNVGFVVQTEPVNASGVRLTRLLKASLGNKMKAALSAAKLNVAESLTVSWLSF